MTACSRSRLFLADAPYGGANATPAARVPAITRKGTAAARQSRTHRHSMNHGCRCEQAKLAVPRCGREHIPPPVPPHPGIGVTVYEWCLVPDADPYGNPVKARPEPIRR